MDARTSTALLVDDDSASSLATQRRLEDDGYSVVVARSGTEGLGRAKQTAPNVIFIHLVANGQDRLGFIQALRSDDSCRHIPVVVLTGRPTPTAKLKGLHGVNRERW
ncbi:MAG TPA: response regulator [Candidatus Sulfotelmatobacter sp.]|nr:response regulator [Candidatus Sulfotelmatobacter sp.]